MHREKCILALADAAGVRAVAPHADTGVETVAPGSRRQCSSRNPCLFPGDLSVKLMTLFAPKRPLKS